MSEIKIEDSFKDLLVSLIKRVENSEKNHMCEFKTQISQFGVDIAVIKETLLNLKKEDLSHEKMIDNHINQGNGWRKAIVSIIITLAVYGGGFIYNWATMNNEISHIRQEISIANNDIKDLKRTSIEYEEFKNNLRLPTKDIKNG